MATKRKNREIRNILAVLGTAIICAALLASAFLYYYGPSGRYLAGHTLLDAATMEQVNEQDQQVKTRNKLRLTFDRIEFSYFDPQNKQMRHSFISRETYQKFYLMVADEKSLKEMSKNVQALFLQPHLTLLTIHLRTRGGTENVATKIFQVVQFIPEDYFRVQLHEQNEGEWAYFYRPGLYQEIMRLFRE